MGKKKERENIEREEVEVVEVVITKTNKEITTKRTVISSNTKRKSNIAKIKQSLKSNQQLFQKHKVN